MQVFAADGQVSIKNVDDLMALNNNLSANAVLDADLTLNIDSAFASKYGTQYIGSENRPFTGTFDFNGHKMEINVVSETPTWGLFYKAQNATFKNSKWNSGTMWQLDYGGIEFKNVQNKVVGFGGLVYYGSGIRVNNVSVLISSLHAEVSQVIDGDGTKSFSVSGTRPVMASGAKDLTFGAIACILAGSNNFLGGGEVQSKIATYDTTVSGDFVHGIVGNLSSKLSFEAPGGNVTTYDSFVYTDGEHVTAGGIAGIVSSNGAVNGTYMVRPRLYVASPNAQADKAAGSYLRIGGVAGDVLGNVYAYYPYDRIYVSLSSIAKFKEIDAGGVVGRLFDTGTDVNGIESGSMTIYMATDSMNISDSAFSYTSATGTDAMEINLAAVAGKKVGDGSFAVVSVGNNFESGKISAKNATVNLGAHIGKDESSSGTDISIEDNGSYIFVDGVSAGAKSNYGYFIGNTTGNAAYNIRYNIIDAVDENSLYKDYSWVKAAIGNIPGTTTKNNLRFKNNYFGWIEKAEVNKATKLYTFKPIDQYGDKPVESTDSKFPFIAKYQKYSEGENRDRFPIENNAYLTISNASQRGIGTVTVTKECKVGLYIDVNVVGELAESGWGGHVYNVYNILNYSNNNSKDDDNGGGGNKDDQKPELKYPMYEWIGSAGGSGAGKARFWFSETKYIDLLVPSNVGVSYGDGYFTLPCSARADLNGDGKWDVAGPYKITESMVGTNFTNIKSGVDPDLCLREEENKGGGNGTGNNDSNNNNNNNQNNNNQQENPNECKQCELNNRDDLTEGFPQPVVSGSINAGKPLPAYIKDSAKNKDGKDVASKYKNKDNLDESSVEVKFNYFNLPYEIRYMNMHFDDISGNLYESQIIEAANRMIVNGVGDNKFEPDRPITRAEFAAMVVRALGLVPTGMQRFTDVPERHWAYEHIGTAASWNIIWGIGDGTYLPERNITRQEAMLIISRAAHNILLKNGFEGEHYGFYTIPSDYSDVSAWAEDGAQICVDERLIDTPNNELRPQDYITRAETVDMILRLLKNYEVIDKD